MKRFTLSFLSVVLAVAAWAHRDVYFTFPFELKDNWGHSAWSHQGADFTIEDGAPAPFLYANGFYEHAGVPSILVQHDSRAHGQRLMPNLTQIVLTVACASGNDMAPHITPIIELEDEYGEKVYFDFAPLEDDGTLTQTVTSTGMRGDMSIMEKLNYFRIYFDGVVEGEIVAPMDIAFTSDWMFPSVSGTRTVTTTDYGASATGLKTTETGVTYIQAEDFDERWINGRLAHSTMSGDNGYRMNREDQNGCRIDKSDDGSNMARWDENHGRVLASHVVTATEPGKVIWDFCPSGADWEKYYGEYAEPDGGITVENAFKNWGAWTEYTFDVEQDCDLDISLRIGCHRSTYEGQLKGSSYWGEKPDKGGYYLVDYPDQEFFELYGHKYLVNFDGETLYSNYATKPVWAGNGTEFMRQIVVNPEKWGDNTVTVNGEKKNSQYLTITPYPFWAWEADDENLAGNGWQPHYISDIVKEAQERGLCSATAAAKVPTSDYTVKVKKGRHTIKVQNCGGISQFDEIRLAVANTGGVENVLVDGDDNAFEGTPVYYDLQGRIVEHPTNGIFIRKSGSKTEKVVM